MRDVVLMTATYRYVRAHTAAGLSVLDPLTTPLQVNPTTISKINTALQFVTLAVGIVHPALVDLAVTVDPQQQQAAAAVVVAFLAGPALPALCWTTGATTILSFASYAFTNHSTFTETKAATTTATTTSTTATMRRDERAKQSEETDKTTPNG